MTNSEICRSAKEGALLSAVAEGNFKLLKFLQETDGFDIILNSHDPVYEDRTPLMLAAQMGQPKMVQTLLKLGAKLSARDAYNRTSLMLSTRFLSSGEVGKRIPVQSTLETIRILVNAGADIHAKDSKGQSAIFYASQFGLPKVIELLLELGANIEDRDINNLSVLSCAKNNHIAGKINSHYPSNISLHSKIIQLLLDAGATE